MVLKQNTIVKLQEACENNEQYSRRYSVRIHGFETKKDEKSEAIMNIIRDVCKSVKVPFVKGEISRAHRIGKTYIDKKSGKEKQSIIVKFKDWQPRTRLYKACPQQGNRPATPATRSARKPGPAFSITADLTNVRYKLLQYAHEKADMIREIDFVFSDVNCRLGLSIKKQLKFFNNREDFDAIIASLSNNIVDEDN